MAIRNPNPIDRHVGARIRMQRIVGGFSQTELGKAVGVTLSAGAKIREGR
jgi:DNA-binding XRE family transcriptional regulator